MAAVRQVVGGEEAVLAVWGSGLKIEGMGFGVWGMGWGLRLRVCSPNPQPLVPNSYTITVHTAHPTFRVWGVGCGVQGVGFGILGFPGFCP